jgi:nucleoside-diphosphate-sugar epimerase
MITILGAGGAISSELVKELAGRNLRLVSRHQAPVAGAETVAADVSDLKQTIAAVSGSSIVYLLVGLKYDLEVWQTLWPRVMRNTIEACKQANAKLVFFDSVYMYGKVEGPITEETPFHPLSKKGEVRARIATELLNEIQAGRLTALIARSADFYGPNVRTSAVNILVFDKFAKGRKALWLVNDSVPHSFTFTPDAAKSLVMLADSESAWNQTWHVATAAPPLTGKEFIGLVAREFGCAPAYRVLSRPVVKLAGPFDQTIRETYEMLYQWDSPYIFDSTKFTKTFGFEPTSYVDGPEPAAITINRARVGRSQPKNYSPASSPGSSPSPFGCSTSLSRLSAGVSLPQHG